MTYFAWLPDYSVGDATLDAQHQELIKLMNELHALLHEPADAQNEGRIETIFSGLAAYIVKHFAYEEQRIAAAGYPEEKLAAHRHEHDALVKQVRQYQTKVLAGEHESLKDLLPYLYGEWLIHHICQRDRDYMPYLAAQAVLPSRP